MPQVIIYVVSCFQKEIQIQATQDMLLASQIFRVSRDDTIVTPFSATDSPIIRNSAKFLTKILFEVQGSLGQLLVMERAR